MGLLSGKTAIVTGAARGIGKAIALKFASEGANIAFTDLIIDENAEATTKEIEALGVKAKGYASNAANFEDTAKVVEAIHADLLCPFDTLSITIALLLQMAYLARPAHIVYQTLVAKKHHDNHKNQYGYHIFPISFAGL